MGRIMNRSTHTGDPSGTTELPSLLAPIWRHAAERPGQRALVDDSKALTYAELKRAIEIQIGQFKADGISAGDAVLVLFDVRVESVIAYWALHAIGAVIVVGDPTGTAADIEHYVKVSGAVHLLASPRVSDPDLPPEGVAQFRLSSPAADAVHVWKSVSEDASSPPSATVTHRAETGMILFSSGTTSRPKAIVHSREAMLALHETLLKTWRLSDQDVVLGSLPFFTIYGLIFSAGSAVYAGSTLVLIERFTPERALQAIDRHKITTAAFVPAMIVMMLNFAEKDRYDCSSLRMVYSASAPISEAVIDRFNDFAGTTVICNYGMTEIPGAAVERAGEPHRSGSAGRVSPDFEITIRGADGEVLPIGETGEIAMRGPTQMLEYLGDPSKTAKRVRDGWIYSEDKGKMDADGYVHVSGRTSELIIRGGLNISPLEVENALSRHADVGDVAVAGPEDSVLGQIISAFIVPRETLPSERFEDILTQHCRQHLAPPKIPAEFFLISEIPRNAAGKINRKALLALRDTMLAGT